MDIDSIKEMCNNAAIRWTNHIVTRLLQRGISMDDVEYALTSGEIIEQYADDYPYPSCLVLGMTAKKQCLHVVCGAGDSELWLITAYYPSPDEWMDDFKVRKESGR